MKPFAKAEDPKVLVTVTSTAPDAWGLPLSEDGVQPPGGPLHDGEGRQWLMTEEVLASESTGERLARIPGHMAYWSAWYAFFPNTDINTDIFEET